MLCNPGVCDDIFKKHYGECSRDLPDLMETEMETAPSSRFHKVSTVESQGPDGQGSSDMEMNQAETRAEEEDIEGQEGERRVNPDLQNLNSSVVSDQAAENEQD
eukprot:CAMPEP_0168615272 /NCGR_PEP_ID=MMETSP0449_2-20121227/4418_1 /TAXON_ID=1082188 /ORGANISM="Strombidium rassoulzadegani, Strain ras09" /LENGTH=103 /DNA_ID=CAMNT_0008656005 /DNA_START=268 /DNA_END=579 /DNA_ORIENTATION=+